MLTNRVFRALGGAFWALGVFASQAIADQIRNGGFESGDFRDWQRFYATPYGTYVTSGSENIGPTEGAMRAEILSDPTNYFNIALPLDELGLPVPDQRVELESFLNLEDGTFTSRTFQPNLSAIKQTVRVRAGQTLKFDWNLVTNEPKYYETAPDPILLGDEAAWVTIGGELFQLANVRDEYLGGRLEKGLYEFSTPDLRAEHPSPSVVFMKWQSGWRHFSFLFSQDAEFDLGFIASESLNDDGTETGMLLDNVRFTPVPSAASMGVVAMAVLGFLSRRGRQMTT